MGTGGVGMTILTADRNRRFGGHLGKGHEQCGRRTNHGVNILCEFRIKPLHKVVQLGRGSLNTVHLPIAGDERFYGGCLVNLSPNVPDGEKSAISRRWVAEIMS
jgi:hypothetical protein